MKFQRYLIVSAAALLLGGGVLVAEEAAPKADHPKAAKTDKAEKPKKVNLPKGYDKLTDLTEEQKTKLGEIQTKLAADRKELEIKATADMQAVLTDAQKAELAKVAEEAKMKKPEGKGTTQPEGKTEGKTEPK